MHSGQSTYEMQIKNKEITLENVPVAERTPEVCLAAVTIDANAFTHVPSESRTDAILIEVASKSMWIFSSDNPVTGLLNESICIHAVTKAPFQAKDVPIYLQTEAVWLAAVKQNWSVLKDIPVNQRSEAICIAAVQQNSKAFDLVPNNQRANEKIYIPMIQLDARAINYIPETDRASVSEKIANLPIDNKVTLSKFDKLGTIGDDQVALVLAAKMKAKGRENSIFMIHENDREELYDNIKRLITNPTSDDIIKFQIIYNDPKHGHYVFGQFLIDKKNTPPTVKYFHSDPAFGTTSTRDVVTDKFLNDISQIAKIEIYESEVHIQKGLGCSYFSIDGSLMLSTPDRPYVQDIYAYMESHKSSNTTESNGVKDIKARSLPIRLARGMQYYDDEVVIKNVYTIPGIKTHLADAQNPIVNKKGELAEASVSKDLLVRNDKTLNMRVQRKRVKYQKDVSEFLNTQTEVLTTSKYNDIIDAHKIKGFKNYCDKKLAVTADLTLPQKVNPPLEKHSSTADIMHQVKIPQQNVPVIQHPDVSVQASIKRQPPPLPPRPLKRNHAEVKKLYDLLADPIKVYALLAADKKDGLNHVSFIINLNELKSQKSKDEMSASLLLNRLDDMYEKFIVNNTALPDSLKNVLKNFYEKGDFSQVNQYLDKMDYAGYLLEKNIIKHYSLENANMHQGLANNIDKIESAKGVIEATLHHYQHHNISNKNAKSALLEQRAQRALDEINQTGDLKSALAILKGDKDSVKNKIKGMILSPRFTVGIASNIYLSNLSILEKQVKSFEIENKMIAQKGAPQNTNKDSPKPH